MSRVDMAIAAQHDNVLWRFLLWIARLGAIAAIVPLMLIAFGEPGTGPWGLRTWIYLALFPFGFSAAYLAAWRWPLVGGAASLACLVASLLVIGKPLPWQPYAYWAVLSLPGILFIIAGWKLRSGAKTIDLA